MHHAYQGAVTVEDRKCSHEGNSSIRIYYSGLEGTLHLRVVDLKRASRFIPPFGPLATHPSLAEYSEAPSCRMHTQSD